MGRHLLYAGGGVIRHEEIANSILLAVWPTCTTVTERERWIFAVRELVGGPVREILLREIRAHHVKLDVQR